MKNQLFTLLLSVLLYSNSFAQYCSITVSPLNSTVCLGDSVLISSVSNLVDSGQAFDFNNANIPAGWSTGGGSNFSTPCGTNQSGTPYYWASTAGSGTPMITTAAFDVTCGGFIIFDMVYAIQSQPSPCEGPDEADEGVSLQYSINGGTNWINIIYYSPGGFELAANPNTNTNVVGAGQSTPYTSWSTFTVPIPAGALSSNTKFRWIQTASSSSANDNWGLDDIIINSAGAPCGSTTVVNWDNGLMDTDEFWYVATGDTTFQAFVYDTLGAYHCSSAFVNINVTADQMTYNLVDTVYSYCPTFTPTVGVTNIGNSVAPYTVTWGTPTPNNNPTILPTSGLEHDTLVYYVTITDACNYERQDSVVMIINQLLNIDTMYSFPASACANDGAVSGVTIGLTGTPSYNWSGPGANSPNFINASVFENLSSGWYYFSVTDNVCSDFDSVFVDLINPPIASFTVTPDSGCDPLNVVITNESQNATNYFWDFGNGNVLNVNNMDSQNQTYSQNSTITLIAYSSPTCADTAYMSISVVVCGCMSPLASNYNPNAVVDDGSCFYPIPDIYIPNVFTPNGDNSNDVFFLDVKNHTNIELSIVNRWGNLIFEGSSLNPTWDGKTEGGNLAADGVYFFKYIVTAIDGSLIEGHGFVQLLR